MSRRGLALFALMSVLWGLPYFMIKVAVRHLTPATVVEGRDPDRGVHPGPSGPPTARGQAPAAGVEAAARLLRL